jgi:pyruvate kinase
VGRSPLNIDIGSEMATIQTINVGNLVNDGLGDDLRTAFQKVNANFANLNAGLTITAANTDPNLPGVFWAKVDNELRFRSLVSGDKILIEEGAQTLTINSTQEDAFIRFDTDSGSLLASDHEQITLQGIAAPGSETGIKDIEVTTSGSSVNFKTIIPVTEYLQTYDFGSINGVYQNAIQLAMQTANIDFGTLTFTSDIDLDCGGLT